MLHEQSDFVNKILSLNVICYVEYTGERGHSTKKCHWVIFIVIGCQLSVGPVGQVNVAGGWLCHLSAFIHSFIKF